MYIKSIVNKLEGILGKIFTAKVIINTPYIWTTHADPQEEKYPYIKIGQRT